MRGDSAETWNGHMKVICEFDGGAGIVSDLKRMSVDCDEVVEVWNDCVMESDVAHEICHGGLLDRDLGRRRERIRLAHVGVVVTGVVAEIAILCVTDRDQYLFPFRGLHLCDHRHGSRLYVHAQSARADRDVVIGLDARHARFGGRSRSCRSALVLRGGVVRRRLSKSVPSAAHASLLPAVPSVRRLDCLAR